MIVTMSENGDALSYRWDITFVGILNLKSK